MASRLSASTAPNMSSAPAHTNAKNGSNSTASQKNNNNVIKR